MPKPQNPDSRHQKPNPRLEKPNPRIRKLRAQNQNPEPRNHKPTPPPLTSRRQITKAQKLNVHCSVYASLISLYPYSYSTHSSLPLSSPSSLLSLPFHPFSTIPFPPSFLSPISPSSLPPPPRLPSIHPPIHSQITKISKMHRTPPPPDPKSR